MAAEEELKVDEESGGKGKIIIIGAVVAVLAIGGGAFFMMGGDDAPPEETVEEIEEVTLDEVDESANTAERAPASVGTALYVAMPRPFVFNVPGAAKDRLVQIKVQLLVRGSQNEENAKKHIPLIEGALLRVFSGANADELATIEGKEALKSKALTTVQEDLNKIVGNKIIESVLFTGFVMQ